MPILSAFPKARRLAMLSLLCFIAACSRSSVGPNAAETRLYFIGNAYRDVSHKMGHPPRDAEELKPRLRTLGDPEVILVSANDGQPFTIRWGIQLFRPGLKGVNPILAHESTGVGDKKYVLDNMLRVQQMTESELDQALQATAATAE